jgi:hypothetical protein
MPAIDKNAFFKYNETRALAGYKSAWLVKHPEDTSGKYSLIGATETVPYVLSDKGTIEFNILQSPVIGQVEDKRSLEEVDVEVLHHRDNAYRYEKLKGKVLEFMSVNAEMMGYKFVGTLDYRPNTAESDINKATVTITPMSAETTPVYNARPEIIETLCFKSVIPQSVAVNEKIDLSVVQNVSPTVTIKKIADGTNVETDATDAISTTEGYNSASIKSEGLYAIKVSAEGYAPWTTTVYVEATTA